MFRLWHDVHRLLPRGLCNTHQAFRSEQAAAWASPYRLFGAQTATRSLWTTLVCSSAMCSRCVGATGRPVKRSVTVHASLILLQQWSTFAVNWFTNRGELILETLKQKGSEGSNDDSGSSHGPVDYLLCLVSYRRNFMFFQRAFVDWRVRREALRRPNMAYKTECRTAADSALVVAIYNTTLLGQFEVS